jgi:short-subunit dehydrogenase
LLAELAKDGIDVLVVCPGLTRTNFSRNMLEQKALVPMDHLRGMTPEQVAAATLRSLEKGRDEVCLTWQGRLLVLLSRFWPALVDRITRRKVRALFRAEVAARQAGSSDRPVPGAAMETEHAAVGHD